MTSIQLISKLTCVTLLLLCSLTQAQMTAFDTDPIIDWPMRDDPNLVPPNAPNIIPDMLHQMWKTALDKPEQELRIAVMQSICKAQDMGITGLLEIYGVQLKGIASNPKSNQALAMMTVQTLIKLNDTSAADVLLKFNKTEKTDWILLTDATLAKWKVAGADDIWLARASNPQVSWTPRQSALEQLAITAPEKAQGPLRQLLGEKSLDPLLKLSAAKALGQIAKRGLVGDAQRLAKGDVMSRLTAIACLASHDSDDAISLAQQMVSNTSEDPAVILAAGEYLLAAKPARLVNHVNSLCTHRDASIRMLAAKCLIDQINTQRVPLLASMLADANPQTRKMVRDAMIKLASQSQLSEPIKSAALDVLKDDRWEGQEQAAIVLGKLDVESTVSELFNVMEQSPREEARIAAAAAIRWMDVADRNSQALEVCQKLFKLIGKDMASPHANELAQLLQWLGNARYEPATSHFIEYIPKNIAPSQAREAAVWAIGKIGKNAQTQNLGNKLMARVKDMNEMNPESPDVQLAAIVTLTRLGNTSLISRFLETATDTTIMIDPKIIEAIKTWAQAESDGKPFVMPTQEPTAVSGWYLQPDKMPAD